MSIITLFIRFDFYLTICNFFFFFLFRNSVIAKFESKNFVYDFQLHLNYIYIYMCSLNLNKTLMRKKNRNKKNILEFPNLTTWPNIESALANRMNDSHTICSPFFFYIYLYINQHPTRKIKMVSFSGISGESEIGKIVKKNPTHL